MDSDESAGRRPNQLALDAPDRQERINITDIYMESIGAAWDDIDEDADDD